MGYSLNGPTEAIRTSEHIDWLHVRHEEVAAFAAGAGSQVTVRADPSSPNENVVMGVITCFCLSQTRIEVESCPGFIRAVVVRSIRPDTVFVKRRLG